MIHYAASTRELPFQQLLYNLVEKGEQVDTGHWQALKNVPHTRTVELQRVVLELTIQPTVGSWASYCQPNLPWAEDHFQERVAGDPANPGEQYKNWPWFDPEWEAQDGEKQFSHTYMERFWPREAGDWLAKNVDPPQSHHGIRFAYGDVHSLVDLLRTEPTTRQAYLPIWFPEDLTAACEGHRVPCTLGYHLMRRKGRLHCFYPMRSVDLMRYLRDDAYMAGRLVQWILAQLEDDPNWGGVEPGSLTMFMSSLHVFEDEMPAVRRKLEQLTAAQ